MNEKGARAPHELQEDFLSFWAAYPRKVGQAGAFISWERQNPPIVFVLAALDWQLRSPDWIGGEGGDDIPNPATYLNHRLWEQEPPRGGGPPVGPLPPSGGDEPGRRAADRVPVHCSFHGKTSNWSRASAAPLATCPGCKHARAAAGTRKSEPSKFSLAAVWPELTDEERRDIAAMRKAKP